MRRALADPLIEARRKQPIPDPAIEALVEDIIGKVADRWTMLILEALHQHGTLRFTQLGRAVGRISQKMLTQTVRQMEQDGLVRRTVHPVIPPHVDYALTPLGESLGAAFCAGYGSGPRRTMPRSSGHERRSRMPEEAPPCLRASQFDLAFSIDRDLGPPKSNYREADLPGVREGSGADSTNR